MGSQAFLSKLSLYAGLPLAGISGTIHKDLRLGVFLVPGHIFALPAASQSGDKLLKTGVRAQGCLPFCSSCQRVHAGKYATQFNEWLNGFCGQKDTA